MLLMHSLALFRVWYNDKSLAGSLISVICSVLWWNTIMNKLLNSLFLALVSFFNCNLLKYTSWTPFVAWLFDLMLIVSCTLFQNQFLELKTTNYALEDRHRKQEAGEIIISFLWFSVVIIHVAALPFSTYLFISQYNPSYKRNLILSD